jgi:hypothetical protein
MFKVGATGIDRQLLVYMRDYITIAPPPHALSSIFIEVN